MPNRAFVTWSTFGSDSWIESALSWDIVSREQRLNYGLPSVEIFTNLRRGRWSFHRSTGFAIQDIASLHDVLAANQSLNLMLLSCRQFKFLFLSLRLIQLLKFSVFHQSKLGVFLRGASFFGQFLGLNKTTTRLKLQQSHKLGGKLRPWMGSHSSQIPLQIQVLAAPKITNFRTSNDLIDLLKLKSLARPQCQEAFDG